jgi:hypothetical protein
MPWSVGTNQKPQHLSRWIYSETRQETGTSLIGILGTWLMNRGAPDTFLVFFWNIRELNDENKHRVVRAKIGESSCIVFCLQETKMQNINSSFTKKIASKRFNKFAFNYPPYLEAPGGILVGWNFNESALKEEVAHGSSLAICAMHSPELAMHKHGNSLLFMCHMKGKGGVSLSPGYKTT